ncbi:MAG: bifunctional alpha/beta hydrolase/class I SAM-dependent methyltransferase [Lentisphaerae bacterium]|nr:bifunctional alpha/beta hydrolase/class I SAM-dependent methyltransferase [Lentisphaerota bacterium]
MIRNVAQETDTALHVESTGTFPSWDGTTLFCRTWRPRAPDARRALILLHRGHEHSGRLAGLVAALNLPDFWAFAFDVRGHGQSPGERGYAEHFDDWIRDLDAFVRHVSNAHGIPVENMAVVGNSLGAVTACAWVHAYAPRIRCMVLAAPAFDINLYVPLARPMLRLLNAVRRPAFITSYVKARMLTHDPVEIERYDADPLITRRIAVNILLELHDAAARVVGDAGAIVTPTLVLAAGRDVVVKRRAQERFFRGLGASVKSFQEYPGFYHALLYEQDRAQPIAAARAFILKAFDVGVDRQNLLRADEQGYTRGEYARLSRPSGLASALNFGVQRLVLKTLGRLSAGVRIGWTFGFDSGQSLDHVYANRARGCTSLGRVIDRGYLDAIGWRGVRQRKQNLEALLRDAIASCATGGGTVRILDVASGPGRYLLETAAAFKSVDLRLQDWDERNLAAARDLAAELGVTRCACVRADAFDGAALAALRPRPHIVVVSGLYELFPDNRRVLASLAGIAAALEPGGFLLYTGQPWHPQLEMIARVLINRDGQPWIMRRRTQAELDELVRSVGLEKQATRTDRFGIFTVSIAQKQVDA